MAKKLAKLVSLMALLMAILLVLWKQQDIVDWWRLRDYHPSASVIGLADTAGMNDRGRRLFYVNYPTIDPKASFNSHCQGNEHTIVLGCYVSNQGIFVLDVEDVRLEGVEQVTAAHEMLHAAYERLSSAEKTKINALLDAAFNNLQDERLQNTIELYRQKDPAVVHNELHSILGTEVAILPAELEQYYQRYFADRAKVVAQSEKYEHVFTSLRAQVNDFDSQLEALKTQIDALEQQIKSLGSELDAQRQELERLLQQGDKSGYNAGVGPFNTKINVYNTRIGEQRNLVTNYNSLVERRNALALEQKSLLQAIDSNAVKQTE